MNKKLCSHNSLPDVFKDNKYITSGYDKANKFLNSFYKPYTADGGLLGDIISISYCQATGINADFLPASIRKHPKFVYFSQMLALMGLLVFFGRYYIMFFYCYCLLYLLNFSLQKVCNLLVQRYIVNCSNIECERKIKRSIELKETIMKIKTETSRNLYK